MLLLSVGKGFAQYFDSGQDPGNIHWKQIRSQHFQVIFPSSFSPDAQKLTNMLERSLSKLSVIPNRPGHKCFPVIIHNYSSFSNGMVSWAPKRMDIYPLPPQSNYPQDWLEQLAIHELRHALQLERLNTGLSHWFSILTGEQFTSLVTGLYIPSWFLEGDAVVAETALSSSGRGRVPNFEMELRAQLLENKKYSFDKAVFGSYRDFIPDKYNLGYYLVGTGRKLFGKDMWDKPLEAVSENPLFPNPFNRGMKKSTGLKQQQWYGACMNHLDSLWRKQDSGITVSAIKKIKIKETSRYADYHFPAYGPDGSVLAFRSSIDEVPAFVSIDSLGRISKLFTPGDINEDAIGFKDNKFYWAENVPDLRWGNRSWSVIKVYDTRLKKVRQLGKKTRWFAPSLSPEGKRVVVVEVAPDNTVSLVIIDENTGDVITRINTPENYLFLTPVWEDSGTSILSMIQGKKGKAIAETNILTRRTKLLTPFTTVEISGPAYVGQNILFLGGYNGIDNVYRLDTNTGEIQMLTSSRFGAHDAGLSEDGSKILYVDYTSGGHQIAEASLSEASFLPLEKISNTSPRMDSILTAQEQGVVDFQESDTVYSMKPYPKFKNLLHFHSWAPAYLDIDHTGLYPGVSFMSQNVLSTAFLTLAYRYNRYEKTGKFISDASYKGFFPVLNLIYSNGLRAATYLSGIQNQDHRFTYREQEIKANISVPFHLTRGKYYRKINPVAGISQIILSSTSSTPDNIVLKDMKSIDVSVTAYNILKFTEKDLMPRWGQVLGLQHRENFPGTEGSMGINAVSGELYFPGFSRHHSMKLGAGLQEKRNSLSHEFSDFISMPRGYSGPDNGTLWALSYDYTLPLFYPDFSIPRFLYIKRLWAGLFADYAGYAFNDMNSEFNSFGTDLNIDCHLFRFYAPFTLGIRTLYLPSSGDCLFEFMYSVNLASF